MNIGQNIKILRTVNNISQKELAGKVGITPHYLSMIENNAKKPSLTLVEKFCQVLDISIASMFSEISLNVN
jgi:transcriptional regulator with XRE-family HTH domain